MTSSLAMIATCEDKAAVDKTNTKGSSQKYVLDLQRTARFNLFVLSSCALQSILMSHWFDEYSFRNLNLKESVT